MNNKGYFLNIVTTPVFEIGELHDFQCRETAKYGNWYQE
jgi:hypothetical protein